MKLFAASNTTTSVAPCFEIMRVFIDLHLDLSRHDPLWPVVACLRSSHNRCRIQRRRGVARVSRANIFNPFVQGWKPDGIPDGSKFHAKNPPKGILSPSPSLPPHRPTRRTTRVLLLFERIFSRMIHWPRGDPFSLLSLSLSIPLLLTVIPIDGNEPSRRDPLPRRREEIPTSTGIFHLLDQWTKLVRAGISRHVSSLSSERIKIFFLSFLIFSNQKREILK